MALRKAAIVFWAVVPFSVLYSHAGRYMSWVTTAPSAGYGPARATLLTLKAALRVGSGDHEGVILLPDTAPSSVDTVALRLAKMPKPVYCGAALRGRFLTVECRHVPSPETVTSFTEDTTHQRSYEGWIAQEVAEDVETVIRAHGNNPGRASVLLQGHDESILLSVDEFQEWLRDYAYLVNVARAAYDSDQAEARARGASIMYRVGPAGMPLR